MTPIETKSIVFEFVCSGKLESAWDVMQKNGMSSEELDFSPLFDPLERKIRCERANGDVRAVNRLDRRMRSLKLFREHGLVPEKLISSVDLREGYQGNLLLVQIVGGTAHGFVCLRSGDDWHREILKNAKEEIQDLGFENSDVVPAGGASVRFEQDDAIIVYGSSEEFGACDKKTAADLISSAFPGRKILTHHY